MAIVYGTKRRPIGKIWPHQSGSIAAATNGRRLPVGLYVTERMAVLALMDCANRPLTIDAYLEWCEALLADEPAPLDGAQTYKISADLL